MKARAHVVHSVRGRTRFRVRDRRHDRRFFREVETRLARSPEVKSVATDPLTGSVLVQHSGSAVDLLKAAVGAGLGELVELAPAPPPVARLIRAEIDALDRLVQRGTTGQLDLSTVAIFGLCTLAIWQFARGNHSVVAVSLAWYASELLRRWEEPSGGQDTFDDAGAAHPAH